MKNKNFLVLLAMLLLLSPIAQSSVRVSNGVVNPQIHAWQFEKSSTYKIANSKSATKNVTAKLIQSNDAGYVYEIYESWGRYLVRFNGLLTYGYVAVVYEYYTGRTCTINSSSFTLVTDDEYSPLVNFSVNFTDPDYGSFPGILSFDSPGNVNLTPWYYN